MARRSWIYLGVLTPALYLQAATSVQVQSPDGRYLVAAITTQKGPAVVMHDLAYEKKGGAATIVIPVNPAQPVVSIVFSADGKEMSTASADGTKQVWRIDRGGAATPILPPPNHP